MRTEILNSSVCAAAARKLLICLLLGTVCASKSVAATAGGYLGVRGGYADAGADRNLGIQSKGPAAEVFAGLRLGAHWAIELGHFGMGLDMGALPAGTAQALDNDLDIRGTALSARYEAPLTARTAIHLRGGISSFDLDYRARYTYVPTTGPQAGELIEDHVQLDESNVGTVLALGVDTALNERWRVGIELQQYRGDIKLGEIRDPVYYGRVGFNRKGSIYAALLSLSAAF